LIQSFTVTNSNVVSVPIPIAAMINNYDVIGNGNGINVVSTAPISVYAVDYQQYASAAFTGYPTPLLGTNYCVIARASLDNYDPGHSEFAVVATDNNTMVTVTPSGSAGLAGGHSTTYSTNLNMGETYQINSAVYTGDVTGTFVTSDKPIAVFAGASLANVPDLATAAPNPLVQQQIPVNDWGTQALALSFAGRSNGASYRILAVSNDTAINITGTVVTVTNETAPGPWLVATTNETVVITTNAGQFYDIGVDGPVEFRASHPIQVAQFANGEYFDAPINFYGDPCEVLLPPTDHYLETNCVVSLPNNGATGDFGENYLNIIVPQSATNSTFVDGSHVPTTNFMVIPNSGYYGAKITLTNSGPHSVTSSQPVGVEAYGWGYQDAYGYFGGVVK
jgi:hypothetical protein